MNARLKSLAPSYGHTLPSDAGRELPQKGRTVDLRKIDVTVVVENDEGDRSAFDLTFKADHEETLLELATIEPTYDDHANAPELLRAAELADDAVHAWLVDIGKDMRLDNPITSPGVEARAKVHTDLEVGA